MSAHYPWTTSFLRYLPDGEGGGKYAPCAYPHRHPDGLSVWTDPDYPLPDAPPGLCWRRVRGAPGPVCDLLREGELPDLPGFPVVRDRPGG